MPVDQPEASEPEKLSSNVMNYMVWRYLQESGYGRAAHQLRREWVGTVNKPDELPFAQNVKKSQLVHLVQDGLYMDNLQAQVRPGNPRRFVFGPDHGPKFSIPAEEPRERRPMRDSSRISSTADRELPNGGSAAETPVPRGPKRKRKSGGNDNNKRMNGDMMDIDGSAMGHASMLDPTVAEAESPLPVIEEAPKVDTLSIGQSKESLTEQPRDLFPDTSFISSDPDTTLEFVKWSPHHPQALFTAGNNTMRTYNIRSSAPENGLEETYHAGAIHLENYAIEGFEWTGEGTAVFSMSERYENEHGDSMDRKKLMTLSNFGQQINLLHPQAGGVVALKYNPDSKLLICLSFGPLAVIRIFKRSPDSNTFELTHDKTMSAEIYDASWTAPNKFMVCGISTLELYSVDTDQISLIKSVETPHDWFRISFDPVCDIVACTDECMRALGIMQLGHDDLKVEVEPFKESSITEIAFQPLPNSSTHTPNSPRLLATATANGKIQIWNALLPFTCLYTFSMGMQSAAQTIAFSPDGFYLAAAGYDKLFVWKSEGGGEEAKAVWKCGGGDERWKCEPGDEDGDAVWLHNLSWDMEGKKIAFGLGGQVAIMRLKVA
ncbi:hypothetical protein EJ08DRAFT_735480 [Tothia fuscella]|uniref:LisH domain-containing protein n=1 Tax=Tothia fuscella TaxID=1048955 RepID=A0A9P4TXC3_9PEZI|nr:hypothetical protein EJ08DRAFT_735480 [Tothia fuscella]